MDRINVDGLRTFLAVAQHGHLGHAAEALGAEQSTVSRKLARLEEILGEALAVGDKALCFTQFAEFGRALRTHLQERLGRDFAGAD